MAASKREIKREVLVPTMEDSPLRVAIKSGVILDIRSRLGEPGLTAKILAEAIYTAFLARPLVSRKIILEMILSHEAYKTRKYDVHEELFSIVSAVYEPRKEPQAIEEKLSNMMRETVRKTQAQEDFFNLVVEVSQKKKSIEMLIAFYSAHERLIELNSFSFFREDGSSVEILPHHLAAIYGHEALWRFLLSKSPALQKKVTVTENPKMLMTFYNVGVHFHTEYLKAYEKRYPAINHTEWLKLVNLYENLNPFEIAIKQRHAALVQHVIFQVCDVDFTAHISVAASELNGSHSVADFGEEKAGVPAAKAESPLAQQFFDDSSAACKLFAVLCLSLRWLCLYPEREDAQFVTAGMTFARSRVLAFSDRVWVADVIMQAQPLSSEKRAQFLLGFLQGVLAETIDSVVLKQAKSQIRETVKALDHELQLHKVIELLETRDIEKLIPELELLGFEVTLKALEARIPIKQEALDRLEKIPDSLRVRFDEYLKKEHPTIKNKDLLNGYFAFLCLYFSPGQLSYVKYAMRQLIKEKSRGVERPLKRERVEPSTEIPLLTLEPSVLGGEEKPEEEGSQEVQTLQKQLEIMFGNSNLLFAAFALKLHKWHAVVKENEVHVPLGQLFPRRRAHIEAGKMFILDRGELTALLKDSSEDLSERLKKRADFLHFKSRQQQQGAVAGAAAGGAAAAGAAAAAPAAAAAAAPAAAEEKKPDPNEVLEEATVNEWYKLDFYLWYLKIKATFRFTSSAADHQALCKSLQYLYNAWVRIDRAKLDPLWKYELPSLKEANNLKTHAEKLLSRAPASLLLFGQTMRDRGLQFSQQKEKEISKAGLKKK